MIKIDKKFIIIFRKLLIQWFIWLGFKKKKRYRQFNIIKIKKTYRVWKNDIKCWIFYLKSIFAQFKLTDTTNKLANALDYESRHL